MIPEGAESMEGFIQRLNELTDAPGTCIFLGDGVPVYEKLIAERINGGYLFADAQDALQRAASVAQLGIWRYQDWLCENMLEASDIKEKGIEHISCFNDIVMDPDDFVPHYIRKPQAERELEAGLLEDPGLHSLKKMNGEKHGRMHKAT